MKPISLVAAIAFSLMPFVAQAQDVQHESHHTTQAAQADTPLASGEVRKVDKDAGKLTIKHGPLANLDMPAMTMVFRVKDAAMLDQLKAGDKVEFEADKIDGLLTVTRIDVKN